MSVTVVRYQTRPERSDENQALIEKVFVELDARRPAGLHYASYRLADGNSFVHIATVDDDEGPNPLTTTPAFAEFQRDLADRVVDGPIPSRATLVGSYGSQA
jgi:hypothetical protein